MPAGQRCPRPDPLAPGDCALVHRNVGAVVGLLVAGGVADRIGARAAGIAWFAFPGGFSLFAVVGALAAIAFSRAVTVRGPTGR
jgi:hypothetical protein